jgi:hypothetical protein
MKRLAQVIFSGRVISVRPSGCTKSIFSPVCNVNMIARQPKTRFSKVKRLGIASNPLEEELLDIS